LILELVSVFHWQWIGTQTNFCLHSLPNADQFKGKGGPEDNVKIESEQRPGDQEVPNLQDLKRRGVAE